MKNKPTFRVDVPKDALPKENSGISTLKNLILPIKIFIILIFSMILTLITTIVMLPLTFTFDMSDLACKVAIIICFVMYVLTSTWTLFNK